jgi:flagellar protein FliS
MQSLYANPAYINPTQNQSGGASFALNAYQKVEIETGVHDASPHHLILMLMDGAVKALYQAVAFIEQNNIAEKGRLISKATNIIHLGLREVLDMQKGGELSKNLDQLYEYMEYLLLMANLHNDATKCLEVIELLNPIREAWLTIQHAPEVILAQSQGSPQIR